ncbi:MAG: segregation/condensation protein A [Erysipelotrichales bacterium]|nr:segregation/condensation protein A [Erysipelotrichales bacterium]
MKFEVSINEFNGPLDLMLHLISEKKMDLMNLDISVLTEQYLAYLDTMEQLHLEIASEYLVELANLIEIKSRKLLPVEKVVFEDEYEEDPQEKLVKRLIEYQRFKDITPMLESFYEERNLHFTRVAQEITSDIDDSKSIPTDLDVYDLLRSMTKMYQRIALSKPLKSTYTVKEVSVDDRRVEVRHFISTSGRDEFDMFEILCQCESKQEFVITFVVLLDMASHGEIHFADIDSDHIRVIKGEFKYDESMD